MSEPSNRLQSTDLTGSIAWAPNDIYSQVFGNERNGRVRGVGFGPTPSGRTVKNAAAITHIRSQEQDAEVTRLRSQVALLTEKITRYDNLEERMTQMASMMQLMQNHFSEVSRVLNFNGLRMYIYCLHFLIMATIIVLLNMISLLTY